MRHVLFCLLIVLAVGVAHTEVTPVVTFDQAPVGTAPDGWKLRGSNGYASKMAVAECEVEGRTRRCLEVEYNFEAERNPHGLNPGAKTVVIGAWLRLPENTRRLRVTLEGDGADHGLVVGVGEAAEWFNFPAGTVDWRGWQIAEVDLGGQYRDNGGRGANGRLDPPLYLASVNLLQNPQGPARGTVRLLGVEAVTGAPTPVDDLRIMLWDSAATGVVSTDAVAQATLRIANPSAQDVSGTVAWKITSPDGYKTDGARDCAVGGGKIEHLPLTGLPERCSYYAVDVRFTAGEARQDKRLSCVVAPPVKASARLRYGLGVFGAKPSLDSRWLQPLRGLGADCTVISWATAKPTDTADGGGLDEMVYEASRLGLQPVGCVGLTANDLSAAVAALPALQQLATRYRDHITLWSCPWLDDPDQMGQLAKLVAPDLRQRLGHPVAVLPTAAANPCLWGAMPDLLADAAGVFCDTLEMNVGAPAEWPPARLTAVAHEAYGGRMMQWGGIVNRDPGFTGNAQPSVAERQERDARGLAVTLLEWSAAAPSGDTLLCPVVNAPLSVAGHESRLFSEWSHPLPAAAAFATIAHLLGNATPGASETRGDYRVQRFATPDGPVVAVWPEKPEPQPLTVRVKATGRTWRIHYLGAREALPPGETAVALGREPVYLQGECETAP
ncbi:hypothetical protein LLH23_12875 [bacterium]|nr:hypothetical protein [bacterium]